MIILPNIIQCVYTHVLPNFLREPIMKYAVKEQPDKLLMSKYIIQFKYI